MPCYRRLEPAPELEQQRQPELEEPAEPAERVGPVLEEGLELAPEPEEQEWGLETAWEPVPVQEQAPEPEE